MEALAVKAASSFQCPVILTTNPCTILKKTIRQIPFPQKITTSLPKRKQDFKVLTAVAPSTEDSVVPEESEERFDWYSEWYPVALVCDLDKRRPHGRKVLGIDVVVWWDRHENAWKVFDDSCPHRLAPLSQGRIDQQGRLQCVYHGWCFGGAGHCKFIPQAPRDGPPIHTSNKACVSVYPSCEQNGIVWFWPNSDPQYKDIFSKKRPHYIPELDDPSYTKFMLSRDIAYGYEILIENLMDPAHFPYSHHGIMGTAKTPERADREGGRPLEINISKLDQNGFTVKQAVGENYFIPPCLYYGYSAGPQTKGETPPAGTRDDVFLLPPTPPKKKFFLIFYCVPVSPGKSRFFFAAPRNFGVWKDRLVPRWISHIASNLILDSDLHLLRVEEHKLKEIGPLNWNTSCFVPTKADALVVAYRRWLNKYGGTQVDWRNKYTGELPPIPRREQLLDRYWTHTVQCSSCNAAYKRLNALEIVLQIISVSCIAIVAAAKQSVISVAARYGVVCMAILCFVASKWLSHFIYKTFRYHDYDHAFR